MKSINYNNEIIEITTEKKKLFGGVSTKTITIQMKDIAKVTKEEFEGNLNSVTFFLKDNNEEFITLDEMKEKSELTSVLDFLIKSKDKYSYEVKLFDIDTLEEKDI